MVNKDSIALLINATAGSGKTTTLVDGINYAVNNTLPTRYRPSTEQTNIFKWFKKHVSKESNVIFLAFSNAIADELNKRITHGEARTLHSLGCQILRENRVKTKLVKGNWKTINLFLKYQNIDDIKDLEKETRELLDEVIELVKFAKDNCMTEDDITEESIKDMCLTRQIAVAFDYTITTPIVKYVIEKGSVLGTGKYGTVTEIDFNDMIYLPARYGMALNFDVMLIDESQDLSPGKLRLVLSQNCNTYVFVGDPNQAIMGFAGADTQSFASIGEALPNHEILPLTFTYRCGKEIVKEAQKIVGDAINYGKTNPNGEVLTINQKDMSLTEGDMLVSRVNAPLLPLAFRLLKEKKQVKIIGRNIGAGLNALIKRIAGRTITNMKDFVPKLMAWRDREINILMNKRQDTEERQIALNDQVDCIISMAGEVDTVNELRDFIKDVFTDDDEDSNIIRLSSIHRSKGLEASRVFFFNPANVPHVMAKSEEAIKQEYNLKFVAITRAINTLVYVNPEKKKGEVE